MPDIVIVMYKATEPRSPALSCEEDDRGGVSMSKPKVLVAMTAVMLAMMLASVGTAWAAPCGGPCADTPSGGQVLSHSITPTCTRSKRSPTSQSGEV